MGHEQNKKVLIGPATVIALWGCGARICLMRYLASGPCWGSVGSYGVFWGRMVRSLLATAIVT